MNRRAMILSGSRRRVHVLHGDPPAEAVAITAPARKFVLAKNRLIRARPQEDVQTLRRIALSIVKQCEQSHVRQH